MANKRKICVITGTRAEYGLLSNLMREIKAHPQLELQIIATAAHLSPEFGLTYTEIEKDGFIINKKVESLLSSDSPSGISKSMGLTMIGIVDTLKELCPDLVLVLGDRFEIFSSAASATVLRIPIAHIAGGELTLGAVDEAFRHSITKMSHLHFTSTEAYKKRVIQLGEDPQRVFNVGSISLDNISYTKLLNKEEFERSIDFKLGQRNLLITYHPVTLEQATAESQFQELLAAIDQLEDTKFIFTMPNADTDGRVIIGLINDYVRKNSHRAKAYTSLGLVRYLSALQFVDAVVGNSSSGILEAPYFKVATINIGDRQKGRIMGETIINCKPDRQNILDAIGRGFSEKFKKEAQEAHNPYLKQGTIKEIVKVLATYPLENIIKKHFHDL
jgi:GDP/UDP-N,N'-diacetylbacillosamine 2-epimerase (hydrolysing)